MNGRACLLVVSLVAASLTTTDTEPVSTKGLEPRVADLTLRVSDLKLRTATLHPRVKDVKLRTGRGYLVKSDVLFAFDSAKLSPGAGDILQNVAEGLRTSGAKDVTITGHTDSVGGTAYNERLSQQRADAVQAYLEGELGDARIHYTAVGKGESRPVAPNVTTKGKDNPNGRAKNRRVTVEYE